MSSGRRPPDAASRPTRSLATSLALVLGACHYLTDPPLAPGSVRFVPPAVYATWWAMTEACSGYTGSLSSVQWYVVPEAEPLRDHGRDVDGYWSAASNRVVLSAPVQLNGALVRHEMLHALNRSPGHPRRDFLTRCAGTVICTTACVEDAGVAPAHPLSVPRVPSDRMEVSIDVSPAVPTMAVNDGFFTLTVSVHNPLGREVVVQLPSSPFSEPEYTFGFRILSGTSEVEFMDNAWDREITHFAADETKRRIFDFRTGADGGFGPFDPGTYAVQGLYGVAVTPRERLVISP